MDEPKVDWDAVGCLDINGHHWVLTFQGRVANRRNRGLHGIPYVEYACDNEGCDRVKGFYVRSDGRMVKNTAVYREGDAFLAESRKLGDTNAERRIAYRRHNVARLLSSPIIDRDTGEVWDERRRA